jgi:RNA polymerase sigma-70 factor (ECF subfamily)
MTCDGEKFAMIFNEIYPALCRFLECLMGEHSAAQDIAQESFLRLYRNGLDAIPSQEVRFWLYGVARNLAINELNRRRTRVRLIDKIARIFSPKAPNPEEQLEQSERNRLVLEMLGSLPEQQRAILLLREQEEMSYSEIARVLNVSESKVKIDIYRARSALRARWREKPQRHKEEREII